MAVGARGVISVASNEVPGRDGAARRGRRAGRLRRRPRDPHAPAAAPAGNFIESNPIPVKAAMAHDGPPRGELPAADGPAAAPRRGRSSSRVLAAIGLRARGGARGERSTALALASREPRRAALRRRRRGADARRRRALRSPSCARRSRAARSARPSPTRPRPPAGGSTSGSSRGSSSASATATLVDASMDHGRVAVLRQGHAAPEAPRRSDAGVRIVPGGSSVRDGAFLARASSACRRCTSTSAPTWTRAR